MSKEELTAVFYFTQMQFTVKLSSKNRELHRIYTNSEIQGHNWRFGDFLLWNIFFNSFISIFEYSAIFLIYSTPYRVVKKNLSFPTTDSSLKRGYFFFSYLSSPRKPLALVKSLYKSILPLNIGTITYE